MRYSHAMLRKHLGISMQGTWWRLLKRAGITPKPLPNGRYETLTKMQASKVLSYWYANRGRLEERRLRRAERERETGPVIPEAVRGKGFAPETG